MRLSALAFIEVMDQINPTLWQRLFADVLVLCPQGPADQSQK
jgi:hypothetical protein